MLRYHRMLLAAALSGWCLFAVPGRTASAQTGDCHPEPTPAQKAAALPLIQQGYELLTQLEYEKAALLYKQALAHTPGPALHLRTGIAFFNALRIVDAHEHIQEALRCGRETLDPEQAADAERRLRVLRARLGRVTVDCQSDGAQVQLADENWFTCGGRDTRDVVAGQYEVQVTKDGHVPVQEVITVSPRQELVVTPTVMSEAESTSIIRRWPRWLPWTVAGAGVVVAAVGAGLEVDAQGRLSDSVAAVNACLPEGCSNGAIQELRVEQNSARIEHWLAMGALAAGTATLAVGVTMLFYNRAYTRVDPQAGTARVHINPIVGRERGGISLRMNF